MQAARSPYSVAGEVAGNVRERQVKRILPRSELHGLLPATAGLAVGDTQGGIQPSSLLGGIILSPQGRHPGRPIFMATGFFLPAMPSPL